MFLQRTLRTLASHRGGAALAALALIIAAGLLSGPAGFGPGEQSAQASLLSEVKKLLASDAEAADVFGRGAAAISGDTIVVGADGEDAEGTGAGAAYIFQRDQGGADNWGQVKKLTASDAGAEDGFGHSVAVSGDTALVGAQFESTEASNAGAVYIFQRNEGGADNWGEVKKLTAPDAEAGDEFGGSVALSGDTAVVGAHRDDDAANNAGAAYVFGRDEGGADNWGQVKKLTASDADIGDGFGTAFHGGGVAVSGDTAVVGAQNEDAGGSQAGAAYVFGRDEGGADNWGEFAKLTASDAEASDNFGRAVAVGGDTALVGAPRESTGATEAGAAYVFERDQGGAGNWGEVKKLAAPVPSFCAFFGIGVAVSGSTAIVGAFIPCGGTGNAYVFERDQGGAGNWGQVNELIPSDGQFGDSYGDGVALSGDTVVVSAPREDEGDTNAGAAYVFDLLQPKPGITPTGTPTPPATSTPTNTPTATPTPTPCPDFDGDTLCDDVDPDDDNDGCTDVAEQQPKSEAATGGGRDPLYYWDFMDMWVNKQKDRRVNIVDIGAVVQRLFTGGDPGGDPLDPPQALTGYHVSADRSPPIGPNLWNAGPPDGDINIIEIGLAVAQFLHDCN